MQTNSIIRLLDENTINQIAAGEVIENSASIIKELVENSIDAKAANITIEIVSGGRQNIRITDDGIGMSFDDVRLSLQRHATSKIKKAEDLSHIHTMGFRGEALSSITSVSKIKIFSKQKNSPLGTYLYAEGGQVLEHKEVECNEGTKIEVSQLFFNAPVRRKFLKSIDVDSANCQKTAIEIALAHPEVSLKLVSNQKLLINAPQGSLENRIKDVLGQDFLNDMRPVIYQDDGIKIEGFLSDPKEVIGKTDVELFGEETAHHFKANDQQVIQERREISQEESVTLQSGEKLVQLSMKRPLYNEVGEVIGIIGNTVDIT